MAWKHLLAKSRASCRLEIYADLASLSLSARVRRNSCLMSRPRGSTKEKASNSFICSGALMNLELGFASSITTLA